MLISEQVQILLERMNTHSEDFYSDNSFHGVIHSRPWLDLVKNGSFSLVERIVINKKLKQLKREMTKNRIITLLVKQPDLDIAMSPTMTIPGYIQQK